MNDMDGAWSAAFYASYSSDPGLTIDGDTLVFKAMPRALTLKLDSEDRMELKESIQSCESE
jgi:hypothetical protein